MITLTIAAIVALAALAARAVAKKQTTQTPTPDARAGWAQFVAAFLAAVRNVDMRGIPAVVALSVAALETGWGSGNIFQKTKNLFSIKARGSWRGPSMFFKTSEGDEPFRVYGTLEESIRDWVDLVTGLSRYYPAYSSALGGDHLGFFQGLQKGGYAGGDAQYAAKLSNTLKEVHKWV